MKLESEIELKTGNDVFWRQEGPERVLLVRPNGKDGPCVRLIHHPWAAWWHLVEQGISMGRLLSLGAEARYSNECVETFVLSLAKDRFIIGPLYDGFEDGSVLMGETFFEDPWEYQFKETPLDMPWFVLWETTDDCNQHPACAFCYRKVNRNLGLAPGQTERIISELSRNRIPFVTLLGGEPLCNTGLEEIIRRLRRYKIYTKVITNGNQLTSDRAAKLGESGLNQIALSLDGLTPNLNDLTRGPEAFKRFALARENLGRRIPMVSLSLTVSSASLLELHSLDEFCQQWNLDEVYLSPLRPVQNIQYPSGIRPMTDQELGLMHIEAERLNKKGVKVTSLKQCSCGRSSVVIQADGSLRPCPFANAKLGNLLVDSLEAIWLKIVPHASALGRVETKTGCFRLFNESMEFSTAEISN